MSLVSYHIANLSNGVSQQPAALRLPTSCESMVNAWPSVVSGLQKRPPTEHIAELPFTIKDNACGHIINRAEGYKFVAVVTHNEVKVFDLDGNMQTVAFPYGRSYLSTARNPVDDVKFLTFGDYTFILNRNVVVKPDKFGEAGRNSTYSPTFTVDQESEKPATATTNQTVFVEHTGQYWRWETTAAKPAIYAWDEDADWESTVPPAPYTLVSQLPTQATAGKKVYIKRTFTRTIVDRRSRWNRDDDGGIRSRTETVTEYKRYSAQETEAAVPSTQGWHKRTLAELTTTSIRRLNPDTYGTVYVTQSVANSYYTIYINNVLKAQFLTKNGVDAANSVESTTAIATALGAALTTAGIDNTVLGSTISISGLGSSDTIRVQANTGDKSLRCYRDKVQSFTDLPPVDVNGRLVKVVGSPKDGGDDYYVVYRDGLWIEEEGWNEAAGIKEQTMPHVLVREEDGTWTFRPFDWGYRKAGDSESNQDPSFVGRTINDIFVFNNRLTFLSDENIIFSESDTFPNFYRKSVATLLDDDRIDIAVVNKDVNILNHAVPFSKDIMLMSDNTQFRLSYDGYLSPKNITIEYTTSFNVSTRIKPINMGNSIYFVDDAPTYAFTRIFEYYTKENLTGDDAEDVTAHVPEYVPAGVRFMAAHPRMKLMVVNTFSFTNRLYVYKYYWAGDQKVQNAWGYWEFPDCSKIHWGGFLDNYLYVLMERNGDFFLEKIKIDEDVFLNQGNYTVHADRRIYKDDISVSYNASEDESTITLPYATSGNVEVVCSKIDVDDEEDIYAFRQAVTRVNSTQFKVNGKLSDYTEITVGVPYTFEYIFSKQYMRTANGDLILEGRLQLRYLTLEFHNTSYFQFTVKQPGREPVTTTFNGVFVGGDGSILGEAPFATGTKRIPLLGNALDVDLIISNDGPFGNAFGAAEWQAVYTPKSKRVN